MADTKISTHGWKTCAECLSPIKKVKGTFIHITRPDHDKNHPAKVL